MPIKIDGKTFEHFSEAEDYVKKNKPEIASPGGYVHNIEENQKKALLTALKLSKIKLKLADAYNDDDSPDNYQYDEGKVYKKKIAKGENLPAERDFKNQLSKGTLVEMEKTRDQDIARSIAEDNLKGDPEYYKKLERVQKYKTIGYAKLDGSLNEIIEWWDGLNVSKRQHAIDPNRLFPESIMTSRKTHEGLVLKEKMEVILGFFFRHQDVNSTELLGYDIKGSAQEWWDTWNVSQRQHMIDPHQYLQSYVTCTKLYDDLSIPERENVDKIYQSKVNEYSGTSRSAMKLASQSGKYAKYWILNAKDVNGNGWGVSTSTIKQNIASFVGKPFVITANTWIPNSEYEGVYDHPYIPSDNMDTVLGYQEKFRVGNIDKIIEDTNGDYYAMIAIDEKYRHLPLPPFCSPAIYQIDHNEPEGDISKWVGLHLAGLMENPAYGPRVAILSGTCVGTMGQCHTQFNH